MKDNPDKEFFNNDNPINQRHLFKFPLSPREEKITCAEEKYEHNLENQVWY